MPKINESRASSRQVSWEFVVNKLTWTYHLGLTHKRSRFMCTFYLPIHCSYAILKDKLCICFLKFPGIQISKVWTFGPVTRNSNKHTRLGLYWALAQPHTQAWMFNFVISFWVCKICWICFDAKTSKPHAPLSNSSSQVMRNFEHSRPRETTQTKRDLMWAFGFAFGLWPSSPPAHKHHPHPTI